METKDHYYLAKKLCAYMDLRGIRKAAFIWGNVSPDVNPITYLTSGEIAWFQGHSYQCRKQYFSQMIMSDGQNNALWWYRVGKMIHYLADSFTRPHNEQFSYTLKEHTVYEYRLHQFFIKKLTSKEFDREECFGGEFGMDIWIDSQHKTYIEEAKTIGEDYEYIVRLSKTVCSAMAKKAELAYLQKGVEHSLGSE